MFTETIRKTPETLQKNDLFKLAGVTYIVVSIEDAGEGLTTIIADQMLGRVSWRTEITLPDDIPFHIL